MSNQAHAEFFAEAGGALALMATKVSHLADLFRRRELKDANEGLTTLASELRDLVVLIGVMQGPLAVEPSRLVVDGVSADDQIMRLGSWLESLVAAQARQDWPSVASILEHDLEPVLRGWTGVLQECAGSVE